VFGAVIARGHDYRKTFQYFKPGFDLAAERQRRAEAGQPEGFTEENITRTFGPACKRCATWDCG
jgi:hypothetical protein